MSTFGVFIEKIEQVWTHPNADKLELAKLVNIDYQFVIGKGTYKAGDLVLYYPEDAILPEALLAKLGLTGKLGGSNKNRVKAIRLRGEFSQGVVGDLSVLKELGYDDPAIANLWKGEKHDWAGDLGVVKYEPQEHIPGMPNASRSIQNPLPNGVRVYDLENAERYKNIVSMFLASNIPVVITEKLEGSHAALHRTFESTIHCSRRTTLIEEDTLWHRGIKNSGIDVLLEQLYAKCIDRFNDPNIKLTLRGELIGPGVQGNIYKLADLAVRLFEVEVNGAPLGAHELFIDRVGGLIREDQLAPVLHFGPLAAYLGGKTLREVSDGNSVLHPTLREGVVIKPFQEMFERGLGRVVIKQRSPLYLSKSEL